MAVNLPIIVALAAAALSAVAFRSSANGGFLPGDLRERACQGKAWRRAFPEASKQDIRDFLSLFVEAFAFRESERLKLAPTDSIMSIYRTLYPQRWIPDGLEVVTLSQQLYKRYGVRLDETERDDVTLGELFAHVNSAQSVSKPKK